MLERTTRKPITFSRLAGVDEKFDAGTYEVETVEELIEWFILRRLQARSHDDSKARENTGQSEKKDQDD